MNCLVRDDHHGILCRSRLQHLKTCILKLFEQREPNERFVFDHENSTQVYVHLCLRSVTSLGGLGSYELWDV